MSPPRLVVALAPEEDSLSLAEGYVQLAAELRRELLALVLEDPGFGQAMALPFARLQPRMAAGQVEIGGAGARHVLKVFRARAESRFAEACRRLEVRWQLSVAESLPALGAGDILVLGPGGRAEMPRPAEACPVVLQRRTGRSVVILYEGEAATLTLGAAVARRERLPTQVLAWASSAEAAVRLAGEAAGVIAAANVMSVVDDDGSQMLARLAALRPRMVVVDACSASVSLATILAALG